MRIPVFGVGMASRTPFVTAKLMQNCYAETRPAGEKSQMVALGMCGVTLFCDLGATPPRGGWTVGNFAYVVHRAVLYKINNAGVATNVGVLLTTTGRVSMSDNGVQLMIVDGTYGYIYNTNTNVFLQITDGDFPANPLTVAFLARRFLVNFQSSGRWYVSDIDNGLSWDATNFANAESNPDNLIAIWVNNAQAMLFGEVTTDYAGPSQNLDFPYAAVQGVSTEWGLAATWSVAKFDNSVAALIRNRTNEVMVAQIVGYLPKKLSNPDFDKIINSYANTADASSYSFMLGGHPMLVMSFPSEGKTWMYDGSTGIWSARKSFGLTRHFGEFGFSYLGRMVIADYSTGRLYRLDPEAVTDNGASIEIQMVSETVASPDLDRITVTRFRIDVEVGVGVTNGQGSDPQIGLEVSRDNGKTWGAQMWRSLGKIGNYRRTVDWDGLGTARNFVFRLTVTDPVQVTVMSACVNPDD